jgi:phage-related protein
VLSIVEAIPQIIEGLIDALPTVISLLIQALLNNLPKIIGGLIQVVIGIVQALPQIFGSLIEGVVNVFAGIWDGLGKVFGNIGGWFKEKFGGAVKAIKDVFGGIGSFFTGVWNNIKNIFSKVGKAIGDAVSKAVKTAVNWVLEKAIGIINGFIKAINFAIEVINLIPGVELNKLSLLAVPKLAKGGIIDSATLAVVGEQGKEAVMPLENNTEWMDMLADKLSAKGAPSKIVLTIDGRELGHATINSINNLTRQTGKLQLALV